MSALANHHTVLGARLAPDGIPLDYGDVEAELAAARQRAILLDRSHEGRILLRGRDRLDLVNRMSTNNVAQLTIGQGAPTIFTNANARILFRAICCQRADDLLVVSEAGQGAALTDFLRRNIFFGDQVEVVDISQETAQFALHGPEAKRLLAAIKAELHDLSAYGCRRLEIADAAVTVVRRKPICGEHWMIMCARTVATRIHQLLLDIGDSGGLLPAGSLTYNSLRIESGRAAGLELSTDYLPLEVGLWDEISFSKGCYTGQEIIARMESRGRIAKALVYVELSAFVAAPAPVFCEGRRAGVLTSSAKVADGSSCALAVLKVDSAREGQNLRVGSNGVAARVVAFAGTPPPFLVAGESSP